MKKKLNIDRLDVLAFLNGLVFYAPVALLVRTYAGVTMAQFFVLQAVLSLTVFLFEIPTGILTDKIGYKNTMVLAQGILVLARGLMIIAYLTGSFWLFAVEAVAEGFAACFLSGTQDAYVYSVYQETQYPVKIARVSNFGTAGFIVSTLFYVLLYRLGGDCYPACGDSSCLRRRSALCGRADAGTQDSRTYERGTRAEPFSYAADFPGCADDPNGFSGNGIFAGIFAHQFLLCRQTSGVRNTRDVDVTDYPCLFCYTDAC